MARYEPELIPELPLAQDSTAQQFAAFNLAHPEVFWAIRDTARDQIRAGRDRLSMKGIFELLRGTFPRLNNTFTAYYTDALIEADPSFDGYFERRHRADAPMRLVRSA